MRSRSISFEGATRRPTCFSMHIFVDFSLDARQSCSKSAEPEMGEFRWPTGRGRKGEFRWPTGRGRKGEFRWTTGRGRKGEFHSPTNYELLDFEIHRTKPGVTQDQNLDEYLPRKESRRLIPCIRPSYLLPPTLSLLLTNHQITICTIFVSTAK